MKESTPELETASAFRRFSGFFIDQFILLSVGIVLGLLFLSSQAPIIERVLSEFGQIISEATPGSVDASLETYMQSDEFSRDMESLQVPYAAWLVTSIAVSAMYYIVLTARSGQTIGKRIVGIKVTAVEGSAISWAASSERYFLLVGLSSFSSLLLVIELAVYGTFTNLPNSLLQLLHSLLDLFIILAMVVGALMIIARADRRGYHDLSAGTQVIKQ